MLCKNFTTFGKITPFYGRPFHCFYSNIVLCFERQLLWNNSSFASSVLAGSQYLRTPLAPESSSRRTGCIDEGDAAGLKNQPLHVPGRHYLELRARYCPPGRYYLESWFRGRSWTSQASPSSPSGPRFFGWSLRRKRSPDRLYEAVVPSRHTCETLTFALDYRYCSKCKMLKSVIWLQ